MSPFTPAELRLLAYADRGIRIRVPRTPRDESGLGTLSQKRALQLHGAGLTAQAIAREAGVKPNTVSQWRKRYGLARKWTRATP